MNESAQARFHRSPTGSRTRREQSFIIDNMSVKVDRKGRGIPVTTLRSLPEPNAMREPIGNRERTRRLRQQERRNAR